MAVFETERLVIREWADQPEELARFFDMYSRWQVVRWLGAQPRVLQSPQEGAEVVRRWRQVTTDSHGRYGIWAIEVRDSGLVAGTVVLRELPDGDGEVEVGWHLHPDSWGQGYATEAARGALAYGFANGLNEIFAVVRPENVRSMKVCQRLGMTSLGRTNKWFGVSAELFRKAAPIEEGTAR